MISQEIRQKFISMIKSYDELSKWDRENEKKIGNNMDQHRLNSLFLNSPKKFMYSYKIGSGKNMCCKTEELYRLEKTGEYFLKVSGAFEDESRVQRWTHPVGVYFWIFKRKLHLTRRGTVFTACEGDVEFMRIFRATKKLIRGFGK